MFFNELEELDEGEEAEEDEDPKGGAWDGDFEREEDQHEKLQDCCRFAPADGAELVCLPLAGEFQVDAKYGEEEVAGDHGEGLPRGKLPFIEEYAEGNEHKYFVHRRIEYCAELCGGSASSGKEAIEAIGDHREHNCT